MECGFLGGTDETLLRTRYMAKWDYRDDADNPGDSLSRRFYDRPDGHAFRVLSGRPHEIVSASVRRN